MKVAFFHFFPLGMWTNTGDMTVIRKMREALARRGIEADLFDLWSGRKDYDIMHLFGFTHELSNFASRARDLGMKIVLSPIAYQRTSTLAIKAWGILDPLIPVSTSYRSLHRLFGSANAVVPGSEIEAERLRKAYGIPAPKIMPVHYGVDQHFFEATEAIYNNTFGCGEFVLMVGRISARKGQLRLLKALDGLEIPVVFIGVPAPYEAGYFDEFRNECGKKPWARYIGVVSDEMLASAYAASKVHVLPSPAECPGMVSLEAGAGGANVVASDDPAVREYLGEAAFYCRPESTASIRDAVVRAWTAPRDGRLRERLRQEDFTWDKAAARIAEIYDRLVN